jgi:large-conductance mechanosensitive channel
LRYFIENVANQSLILGGFIMQEIFQQITETLSMYVPNLLAGLAVLLVGWLVALSIAAIVRSVVKRTFLKNKLAIWFAGEKDTKAVPVEKYISKAVFYLIMLFVLVAFFQTLGLTLITEPLNNLLGEIMLFAPQIIGAIVLFIVAWVIAAALKLLLTKVLTAVKLDEQLGSKISTEKESEWSMTKVIANTTYWLVFLLFLPAIINTLDIQGPLGPLQAMLGKVLEFLPNIFTAVMIVVLGWFLAKIVQRIVSNILTSLGSDTFSQKIGLKKVLGEQNLSNLIGFIVFILILIPVLIAALNALALDSITKPASEMLGMILAALPAIFAAALVIIVSYVVGSVVAKWVTNLLSGLGFNNVLIKLGLAKGASVDGEKSPSYIMGYLVLAFVMVFAVIEAANLLQFTQFSDLLTEFISFAAKIVMGLVIFGLGLFLANWISGVIEASNKSQSVFFALVARISIIILTGAMALRQMGIADDIINMAFGLTLGAIAVATAIAFGIGGRDYAATQINKWSQKMSSKNNTN